MNFQTKHFVMLAAVMASFSGVALADDGGGGDGGDNGLSPGYGDSWAYFRAEAAIAAKSARAQKAQATIESSTPALRVTIAKGKLHKSPSKTFDDMTGA